MVNIGIKLYDNTIHHVGNIASASGAEATITTIVDYQKKAEVEVLVSEPAYSERYCSIGTLLIHNLPPAKAGEPRITLKFLLDADYSLNIHVMSKDVLKKQVKIPKNDWEPSLDKDDKGGKAVSGILFTIDLSLTDTEKHEESVQTKKDKDEEAIPGTKGRDIIIPIIIIASLIIVVFFAVYFFFVLRPWDMAAKDRPEPTRPAATQAIPAEDTPESTQHVIDTATLEPEEEAVVQDEEPAVDLDKINNELKSIGPIYFSPDSAKIKDPDELKKCDRISLSIMEYKDDILLIINGHTAKVGSEEDSRELSVKRALAVREELIARGAITEENCRIEGFGSKKPATRERGKMYLNRRVELWVEPCSTAVEPQ